VKDDECSLTDVISAFRAELALEHVDELASVDLDAVDQLLARGGDRTDLQDSKAAIESAASEILGNLLEADAALFENAELEEATGVGAGAVADLTLPSGVIVGFSRDYQIDPDQDRFVECYLDLDALPKRKAATVRKAAFSLGFDQASSSEDERKSGTSPPEALVDFSSRGQSGQMFQDRRVWTIPEFATALVEIEREARGKGRH
jgi:hypothetical protein